MKPSGPAPCEQSFGPIRFIPGPNSGRYPFCHSLYIQEAGVLVDPAGDRDRLARLRDEEGVSRIWLTHWHEDHWACLDLFPDVPIWMSRADAGPLADIQAFLDAYGINAREDAAMRDQFRRMILTQFRFRPRTPERFLEGGQTLRIGPATVDVIATPGHTPGHLAFFFREPEVLFLGDYDLTPFGPWYGDLGSSMEQTIASVNRLRSIPAKTWLTCHETGVFLQNPGPLWDDYLAVMDRREKDLLALLDQPRTMDQIVSAWIVYRRPREPDFFFRYGERAIMGKHLEKLMAQGKVRQKAGRFQKQSII